MKRLIVELHRNDSLAFFLPPLFPHQLLLSKSKGTPRDLIRIGKHHVSRYHLKVFHEAAVIAPHL